VGWSIDSRQTGCFVAKRSRHGTQKKIADRGRDHSLRPGGAVRVLGLQPEGHRAGSSHRRVGAVGAPFDNAMVEAFWARHAGRATSNRRKWKTRLELATAIHDYIETWHQHPQTPQRLGHAHTNRIREPTPTTTDRRLIPDLRLRETRVRSKSPRNPGRPHMATTLGPSVERELSRMAKA